MNDRFNSRDPTLLPVIVFLSWGVCPIVAAQMPTTRVDVKLRTGGSLTGLVVDDTEHGLVVVREDVPYVFAWAELEFGSAYRIRRSLLEFRRGGREHFEAEDFFQLGLFSLSQGRSSLAHDDFSAAERLDGAYASRIRRAYKANRRAQQEMEHPPRTRETFPSTRRESPSEFLSVEPMRFMDPDFSEPTTPSVAEEKPGLLDRIQGRFGDSAGIAVAPAPPEVSSAVEAVYRSFGQTVQRVISKHIALHETDHFLIWTDWNQKHVPLLEKGLERTFRALCSEWGLDPGERHFLAKCPVFCFRARPWFLEFARLFDGHDGRDSLGYTRSIESNGHVHVVLLRQGDDTADFDRFEATLVHEVTHAFVHRLFSTRLIPHWVNEGYADLTTERMLGDRSFTGENAALLAKQYVRFGWPITSLLERAGPIDVHEYPLAQSIVGCLQDVSPQGFRELLRDLKEGRSFAAALGERYRGLTVAQLEALWRVRDDTLRAERP